MQSSAREATEQRQRLLPDSSLLAVLKAKVPRSFAALTREMKGVMDLEDEADAVGLMRGQSYMEWPHNARERAAHGRPPRRRVSALKGCGAGGGGTVQHRRWGADGR